MDILQIRKFYKTPLGLVVKNQIRAMIKRGLSTPLSVSGRFLCFGYPFDYLDLNRENGIAFMPPQIGAMPYPKGKSRVAVALEDMFPLPDNCIDQLLIVHGFEYAYQSHKVLEECWRVLTPEGSLLIITPNRRGLWARFDYSPLGHGQPYTMTQLTSLLKKHNFDSFQCLRGLYTPPIDSNIMISMESLIEKVGSHFMQKFSGLIGIHARKRVYNGIMQPQFKPTLKKTVVSRI